MKKKPTKKNDNRRFGSFWACHACADNPEFEHVEAMNHLQSVHSIDTKTTKGTRSLKMHMDGDTWFSSTYEWDIAGLKLTQHTCTKRTGDNLAMWQ